jgi:hypothetical protein
MSLRKLGLDWVELGLVAGQQKLGAGPAAESEVQPGVVVWAGDRRAL